MKKYFSFLIALAMLATLCISATGCKSASTGTSDSTGSYSQAIPGGSTDVSAQTLEALANSGTVKIYNLNGENQRKIKQHEEFTKYFEQVYGGKIDNVHTVWNNWEDKFIIDFAANDAPDLVYIFSGLWPLSGTRQLVYSQSELTELGVVGLDHPVIKNSFELSKRNFEYANEVYAVDTYLVTPNVMLVNDTLIKKCGVSKTPTQLYNDGMWNWDSFMQIMAQVCSIDDDRDGQVDYRGYNGWAATYVLNANAGYLIQIDENNKLYANTDDIKVKNGLQMYADVYQKGYRQARGEFEEGKTATFVETHYNVAKKINNNGKGLGFDWSVVPYPLGPDNTEGYQVGGCEAYSIVSSTQNPQGALNYIIAQSAFKEGYLEQTPDYDLEYWLDDEGDQMLDDIRLKVKQQLWSGVGNVWGTQWDFWGAVEKMQSVSELLAQYTPWLQAQCDTENAYSEQGR